MSETTLSIVSSFLLLLTITHAKNIPDTPYTFSSRSDFSSKLEGFQCTYGGGAINNATVIELGNCYQFLYYIGLTLGTGTPQTFYFQFDTGTFTHIAGSPTMWIPMGNPPSGYNSSLSNTYQNTSQENNLTYGDGSYANGYMGSDQVTVSGTLIVANNSPIQWATNVSSGIFSSSTDVQGLVGMDFASTPNFLDIAFQNKQISTPIFSLQLNYVNQTSYLHYNNGLSQSITQNMSWIPQQLNQNGYWQTALTSVTVEDINMTSSAANVAIIDSGTSLVIFNQALYDTVVQKYFSTQQCFSDQNNYITCFCNNTWPQFVFNFSSTMSVSMSSDYYMIPSAEAGFCYMAIVPQNISFIILGDVFMRGYIITFDRINNRMGFYKKGNSEVFNTFNPFYFVATQYVIGALSLIFAIVGLVTWNLTRVKLLDKAWESSLGKEMI